MASHLTKGFLFSHTALFLTKGLEKSLCDFTGKNLVGQLRHVHGLCRLSVAICTPLSAALATPNIWKLKIDPSTCGELELRNVPVFTSALEVLAEVCEIRIFNVNQRRTSNRRCSWGRSNCETTLKRRTSSVLLLR